MATIMAGIWTYDFALSMFDKMDKLTKNDNTYPSSVISFIIVVIYIVVVFHYRGKTQLYTK